MTTTTKRRLPRDEDDRWIFRTFLIILVIAPIPYGSNRPWFWLSLVASIYIVVLWRLWKLMRQCLTQSIHTSQLPREVDSDCGNHQLTIPSGSGLWLLLWGIWIIYAGIQIIPISMSFMGMVSSAHARFLTSTIVFFEQGDSWHGLAIAPYSNLNGILILTACACAFWMTIRVARTRQRMETFAWIIVIVGTGQAVYGLADFRSLLTEPATGTFINRNHFAAFVSMTLMVTIGLFMARGQVYQEIGSGPSRKHPVGKDARVSVDRSMEWWSRSGILLIGAMFMAAGLLFSFSRGAFISVVLCSGVLGACWMIRPIEGQRQVLVAIVFAGAVLLWGGGLVAVDVLVSRFEELKLHDVSSDLRWEQWGRSYHLIRDYALWGIGFGGYQEMFPRVEGMSRGFTDKIWDYAHSDPLQVVIESGVVGGGVVFGGLGFYIMRSLRQWWKRNDPFAKGLGFGCLAGVLVVAVHSFVDFPFHIPAIAVYFSVLLALGWRVIHVEGKQHSSEESSNRSSVIQFSQKKKHWLLFRHALTSVGVLGMACLSVVVLMERAIALQGDQILNQAMALPRAQRVDSLMKAKVYFSTADGLFPMDPDVKFKKAYVFHQETGQLSPQLIEFKEGLEKAVRGYTQAIRLHPAKAEYYLYLGWALDQQGKKMEAKRAMDTALWLHPDRRLIWDNVTRWYLANWELLGTEGRSLTQVLIRYGVAADPQMYMEMLWKTLGSPERIRRVLPRDGELHRQFVRELTQRHEVLQRWQHLKMIGDRFDQVEESKVHLIAHGKFRSFQKELKGSRTIKRPWEGLADGWLLGDLQAKTQIALPKGEALLIFPLMAEEAEGWPMVELRVEGKRLVRWTIESSGMEYWYVLIRTPGGTMPITARITNPYVAYRQSAFSSRSVKLGTVRLLTPAMAAPHLSKR